MGATTFGVYVAGKDAKEAFERAVQRAQYERGHEGYSGTIAEKQEFVIINESLPQMTGPNASKLRDKLIESQDRRIDDKWGPAGAIRVKQNASVATGRKRLNGWLFFGWASE